MSVRNHRSKAVSVDSDFNSTWIRRARPKRSKPRPCTDKPRETMWDREKLTGFLPEETFEPVRLQLAKHKQEHKIVMWESFLKGGVLPSGKSRCVPKSSLSQIDLIILRSS
jgi:hypothetical protein